MKRTLSVAWLRFQYSLFTLVLVCMIFSSVVGTWLHRKPWFVEQVLSLEGICASSIALSRKRVALGCNDGKVRLWSRDVGVRVIGEHVRAVTSVSFSPDDDVLLSIGDGTQGRVWSTATEKMVCELSGGVISTPGISFMPDCRSVLLASRDRHLRVWSLRDGSIVNQYDIDGRKATFHQVSADGRYVAAGTDCGHVYVWRSEDGSRVVDFQAHSCLDMLSFSRDGNLLATAGDEGDVGVWDLVSGARVSATKAHKYPVWAIDVDCTGKYVLTGSSDRTALLRNIEVGTESRLGGHDDFVNHVRFTNDGFRAFTASMEGIICIWDVADGACLASIDVIGDRLADLQVSPSGEEMVAATSDGLVVFLRRRRPEWWWGLGWLPEVWVFISAVAILAWNSLLRRGRWRSTVPGS